MSRVFCIAAIAHGNIIGKDNDMPWKGRFQADLDRFRALTKGNPCIMGRATHESIERVLPARPNIIVTRNTSYVTPFNENAELVQYRPSLEDAIKAAELNNPDTIYIIGGAQIYKEAIEKNLVDGILLTQLDFDCSNPTDPAYKKFPTLAASDWHITSTEDLEVGSDKMTFLHYERRLTR